VNQQDLTIGEQPKSKQETPLMGQYNRIKASYPDAMLLFRVGDFYETFGEDAVKAASILGIVLTRRANGSASHIELAGFPHHSLDTYLPKLVRAGNRVAICDQLEDPKTVKTIVKRGVTELVSPGVSWSNQMLPQRAGNYLAALSFNGTGDGTQQFGIALCDISTGEFRAASGNKNYISKLLQTFRPAEILIAKTLSDEWLKLLGENPAYYKLDEWIFGKDYTVELLHKHFEVNSMAGYGLASDEQALVAAGVCLHYIHTARHTALPHINTLARIEEEKYVWLDQFTIRSLEILEPASEGATSLLAVLDQTVSPMGSRLLHNWLALPLKDKAEIERRHDLVETLMQFDDLRAQISAELKLIADLERLVSRIALSRATPRDILHLSYALKSTEKIKSLAKDKVAAELTGKLNTLGTLEAKISLTLNPNAPPTQLKGNYIAAGVNQELDDLRRIAHSGKDYLLEIQQEEIKKTGISSLKISYNSVFGYYFEVTHVHRSKVPPAWIRKQTLVNAERYITEELKEYEEKILGAEEKIQTLEARIFAELLQFIQPYILPVQQNARIIAELDVLVNFAGLAQKNHYVRPHMHTGQSLKIVQGRHPVIERQLTGGESYVPNDLEMDPATRQIIMITGPNMSGKSAMLRQTALIVLMAQAGSFVPAESARLGVTDKIFSRVGASDNLSSGQSTFMVEMNETASILNNISPQSLLILDEIGRGTSTYDGISLAWAIASFLHENKKCRPKTLFATHYHELNEMEKQYKRIANFHISVKEVGKQILFLRKLTEGKSEHSFGIHVARMAGMPPSVLTEATAMLSRLEKQRQLGKPVSVTADPMQLNIFSLSDPVLLRIRDSLLTMDINILTPIEALMKLKEIQDWLK